VRLLPRRRGAGGGEAAQFLEKERERERENALPGAPARRGSLRAPQRLRQAAADPRILLLLLNLHRRQLSRHVSRGWGRGRGGGSGSGEAQDNNPAAAKGQWKFNPNGDLLPGLEMPAMEPLSDQVHCRGAHAGERTRTSAT